MLVNPDATVLYSKYTLSGTDGPARGYHATFRRAIALLIVAGALRSSSVLPKSGVVSRSRMMRWRPALNERASSYSLRNISGTSALSSRARFSVSSSLDRVNRSCTSRCMRVVWSVIKASAHLRVSGSEPGSSASVSRNPPITVRGVRNS